MTDREPSPDARRPGTGTRPAPGRGYPIRVGRVIEAAPAAVWRQLADIVSHTEWMADARAIRFTGDQREGAGTAFECDTRVGPFTTVDRMVITEWEPTRAMAVRHTGLITGTGRFTLEVAGAERTTLVWQERLRFPRWLGGTVAAALVAPVLRRIWAGNLRRLARRIEPAGEAGETGTAAEAAGGTGDTARTGEAGGRPAG